MKPLLHALLWSGLVALSAAAAALITRNPFIY